MIPRPPSLRDIRRDQEDEARRREQQTNSRKSDNTTVSRGGKFDVDGNFNVRNGGIGTIELGGKMNVRGSLDITDAGEATVTGQGPEWYGGDTVPIVTCLGNRTAWNPWIGYNYTQPGVYFTKGQSLGGLDPRVVSEDGDEVIVHSASELMQYGPQVGPNIKSDSSLAIRPWSASIGSSSWDQSVNYEGREGLNGMRGNSYALFTPSELSIGMENYEYLGVIPQGTIASIRASLGDRKLRLQGMDGVDIKGPFTVDGQPVGGAVTSVAGRTGAVSLVKGDVGLGNVDNTTDLAKPVSNATQTALNGKATSTHTHAAATTAAAGFMSAADKAKLDSIPAGATAVAYYVATGSKEAYAAFDQAITTPVYQAAGSTANLGAPGAGQITISASGIYSVVLSMALFTSNTLATPKAVTGRTFIEVADGSGSTYARTTIALEEDQGTSNHAGLVLAAGSILKFNVLQNTGGIAHYRARIWVIKHP